MKRMWKRRRNRGYANSTKHNSPHNSNLDQSINTIHITEHQTGPKESPFKKTLFLSNSIKKLQTANILNTEQTRSRKDFKRVSPNNKNSQNTILFPYKNRTSDHNYKAYEENNIIEEDSYRSVSVDQSYDTSVNDLNGIYSFNELQAYSMRQVFKFTNTVSILLVIDRCVSSSLTRHRRQFFDKLQQCGKLSLPNSDPRAVRLVKFNFVKKINAFRGLNCQRAFLRWSVRVKKPAVGGLVAKIAIFARINHMVAIYRFKSLITSNRQEDLARGTICDRIEEFSQILERKIEEKFIGLGPVEIAFKRLKDIFYYYKKIELFDAKIRIVIKEKTLKREIFENIKNIGTFKEKFVRKLFDRIILRERFAFDKLNNTFTKNIYNLEKKRYI